MVNVEIEPLQAGYGDCISVTIGYEEKERFKAEKYRGISLALSALFHGNTIKQEKEELFRYTAKSQAHSNKLKLLADMMNVKPKR